MNVICGPRYNNFRGKSHQTFLHLECPFKLIGEQPCGHWIMWQIGSAISITAHILCTTKQLTVDGKQQTKTQSKMARYIHTKIKTTNCSGLQYNKTTEDLKKDDFEFI